MFTSLDVTGLRTGRISPFAEGWLDERSGWYLRHPVDVTMLPDGLLLVSDDLAGAILPHLV